MIGMYACWNRTGLAVSRSDDIVYIQFIPCLFNVLGPVAATEKQSALTLIMKKRTKCLNKVSLVPSVDCFF